MMNGEPIDFRILGPLRVVGPDGEIPLGGRNERAVLASLLLEAGNAVSFETIAGRVWDDQPNATSRTAISNHVRTLRALLESSPVIKIVTVGNFGYRLVVPEGCIDRSRFLRARSDGEQALAAGRPDVAASALRVGLAEWAGPALADLTELQYFEAHAVSAEEDRLGTLEARIDAELALEMYRELTGELTGLVNLYPLREGFWLQLIRALYGTGRQADALAAYQQMWRTWRKELGLDLSPRAQEMASAIQRHEPVATLSAPRVVVRPRPRTVPDHRYQVSSAKFRFPDGSRFPVPSGGLRIGRDPGSDLVFSGERVSWNHAAISVGTDGYIIHDLHSMNGTQVDGVRIFAGTLLTPGAEVDIGGTVVIFEMDEAEHR